MAFNKKIAIIAGTFPHPLDKPTEFYTSLEVRALKSMGYEVQLYSSYGELDAAKHSQRAKELGVDDPIIFLPEVNLNTFHASDFLSALDNIKKQPDQLKAVLSSMLTKQDSSDIILRAIQKNNKNPQFIKALETLKDNIQNRSGDFLTAEKHCAHFLKAFVVSSTMSEEIDVLYAQTFGNGPTIADYASILKGETTWIAMGHNNDTNFLPPEEVKYRFQKASMIMADSQNALDMFNLKLGNHNRNIPVVYRGIDTDLYKPKPVDNEHKAHIKIASIARLEKVKGLDYLIESISMLPPDISCELNIYGDGAERENLQKLIEQHGLQDKITIHGFVKREDVINIIQDTDLHILPAIHVGDKKISKTTDSVSRSMLEMAAGCVPSIVTDAGGLKEFVKDQRNGVIVPEQDSTSLANAITELYRDHEKRTTLGQQARQDVIQQFDYRNTQKDLAQLIEKAMKQESNSSIKKTVKKLKL